MTSLLFLSTLCLLSILAVLNKWNDQSIQKADDQYNALLLLFTLPGNDCPTCKVYEEKFTAQFDEVESWLQSNIKNATVGIGVMDLRDSEATAKDLLVEGAPSMVLVKGSFVHEYGGPLNAESLGSWIARRMEGAISTLKDQAAVHTFETEYNVAIIVYTDESGLVDFEQATMSLREIPQYGWVNVTDSTNEKFNTITVAKHGLSEKLTMKIDDNATALHEWLLKAQMPLIGEINLSNIHAYLQDYRPYIWFVGLRQQFDSIKKALYPVIQMPEFKDKFWWVWLDPAHSQQSIHFIQDKLKPERVPSFLLTDFEGPGRFYLRKSFPTTTGKDVADWLQRVIAGKEERHIASEDVPEISLDDKTKLERIVSKNLETKLLRLKATEQDDEIILFVTSPACKEECQEMQTLLTNLNTYLLQVQLDKKNCRLRIMSIDSYRNELHPEWHLKIPRHPTVYFFPKIGDETINRKSSVLDHKKSVQKLKRFLYEGELHDIDFWEWIKSRSECEVSKLKMVSLNKPVARDYGYDEL